MKTRNLLLGMAAVCGGSFQAVACTGIALTAADGSYVQSRTIEWARGVLQSEYVVIPRGQWLRSFTPLGADGMTFTAKYGVVGLSVVQKEFIAEGINEAGLSAGLFFFPQYGGYEPYEPAQNDRTLADLQFVAWVLTQFSTVDEVKAAVGGVRIVALEKTSVVHWRIGEPSGRQVVLEIVGGVPHFYENEVGVLTNAPGFEWQLTNLNNYVNLYPGDAPVRRLDGGLLPRHGSAARHRVRDRTAMLPPAQQFRHSHRHRTSRRRVSGHSERHAVDLGYRPDQPPDLLQDRLQQYDPLYRSRGDRLRENGLSVPSAGPETGTARGTDRCSGVRRRLRSVFGRFFVGVAGAELLVGEKAG